jgi:hypothetical protein
MEDFKKMEKLELIDLLAKETTRFYRLSRNVGDTKESNQCKATIEEIQSEIERRKKEKIQR